MLYIGRGAKDILFYSDDASNPAKYYLLSCPAHKVYPTKKASMEDAEPVHLGSTEESNKRTIYKLIHLEAIFTGAARGLGQGLPLVWQKQVRMWPV